MAQCREKGGCRYLLLEEGFDFGSSSAAFPERSSVLLLKYIPFTCLSGDKSLSVSWIDDEGLPMSSSTIEAGKPLATS